MNKQASQATEISSGAVIDGRYRIEAEIGRGGMSAVYRAIQISTGRPVALKVLVLEEAGTGLAGERFRNEAKIICSLRSNHTVTVFDVGEYGKGAVHIVMELLRGSSLAELIDAQAPLDEERALGIAVQVCLSLAEAHSYVQSYLGDRVKHYKE